MKCSAMDNKGLICMLIEKKDRESLREYVGTDVEPIFLGEEKGSLEVETNAGLAPA